MSTALALRAHRAQACYSRHGALLNDGRLDRQTRRCSQEANVQEVEE